MPKKSVDICWLVLLALFSLSVFYKLLSYDHVAGPQIFGDELIYKTNAEYIFHDAAYYSTHYPPVYSTLLAVGYWFEDWYRGMLVVNALFSSLLLLPVLLISRMFLDQARTTFVLLLSALLPLHFSYPYVLMAENVSIFIFLFSVYLLLLAHRSTPAALLLGVTCSLAYMTKYLHLVSSTLAILIFIGIVLVDRRTLRRPLLPKIASVFAGFLLPLALWVSIAHRLGFRATEALGFGLKGLRSWELASPSLSDWSLWLSAYVAYFFLMISPLLMPLLVGAIATRRTLWLRQNLESEKVRFLLLTAALTVAFLALAIRHSATVAYNHPEPRYINGRYMMHLMPLYLIVMGICSSSVVRRRALRCRLLLAGVAGICLIATSYFILHRSAIWGLHSYFAAAPWASPDVWVYARNEHFIVFVILVNALLCGSYVTRGRALLLRTLVLPALFYLIFASYAHDYFFARGQWPRHARFLAEFLEATYESNYSGIVVTVDGRVEKAVRHLQRSLVFWLGDEAQALEVRTMEEWSDLSEIEHAARFAHVIASDTALRRDHYVYRVGASRYFLNIADPVSGEGGQALHSTSIPIPNASFDLSSAEGMPLHWSVRHRNLAQVTNYGDSNIALLLKSPGDYNYFSQFLSLPSELDGRRLSVEAMVKSTVRDAAFLKLHLRDDGGWRVQQSEPHPGDDQWHRLVVDIHIPYSRRSGQAKIDGVVQGGADAVALFTNFSAAVQ